MTTLKIVSTISRCVRFRTAALCGPRSQQRDHAPKYKCGRAAVPEPRSQVAGSSCCGRLGRASAFHYSSGLLEEERRARVPMKCLEEHERA